MANQTNFCGIICEFNPLHFGHQEILSHAKQIAPVVCVMSGNFVQRGDVAILDKWQRTELALTFGADLVLELPLPWAAAGAERFAHGAVYLLSALGLSSALLFGSEDANAALLMETAEVLLSEEFALALSQELKQEKKSFAAVREQTLRKHFDPKYADALTKPNHILGVEYGKAILRQSANMQAQTILRIGAGHDTAAAPGEILSASEIRARITAGEDYSALLPETTAQKLAESIATGDAPHRLSHLERAILARLRGMNQADFARLPDISEGLEHRLFAAAQKATSLEAFYQAVKSKRYSHARIRRITLAAFLGLTADLPENPPYLRILGMTQAGEDLLKQANPTLPFAARPSDFKRLGGNALRLFELEAAADDLYALSAPRIKPCKEDYRRAIIRLR